MLYFPSNTFGTEGKPRIKLKLPDAVITTSAETKSSSYMGIGPIQGRYSNTVVSFKLWHKALNFDQLPKSDFHTCHQSLAFCTPMTSILVLRTYPDFPMTSILVLKISLSDAHLEAFYHITNSSELLILASMTGGVPSNKMICDLSLCGAVGGIREYEKN